MLELANDLANDNKLRAKYFDDAITQFYDTNDKEMFKCCIKIFIQAEIMACFRENLK